MGGKITIRPPHSSDLAFGDFQLFEPMKMYVGRQKCEIYDEHKRQDKPFILLALVTCQQDKKLC
jgi:hypothetical protein